MKELKNLKELVETIHNLYSSYEDIGLLIEMGYEDEDPEMVKELEEEIHTFEEVFEKRSAAYLAKGLAFNKFTGSHGKSGSNDANAEYLGEIRRIMEEAGTAYQFAELGKVDIGGGGTIAYIMANYGMDVVDSGVAVLNMHAPYEVSSKSDIYQAVKGYKAFLKWRCEDEKRG